jgi:hypothetical protein
LPPAVVKTLKNWPTLPELVPVALPPAWVNTCKVWVTVPELMLAALPPAVVSVDRLPLTVPLFVVVALPVVVDNTNGPLVPELVQLWSAPLVVQANCAHAGALGQSSHISNRHAGPTASRRNARDARMMCWIRAHPPNSPII